MNPATQPTKRRYDNRKSLPTRPLTILIIVGTFVFSVLTGIELVTTKEPLSLVDITMELLENSLFAGAMVVMAAIASETRILRRQHRLLIGKVTEVAADSEKWRQAAQDVVADLNRAIDSQFFKWRLSEAERRRAKYKKTSLPNRSEFVAFFLDARLAPADTRQSLASSDLDAKHSLQKLSSFTFVGPENLSEQQEID
jgi:hypothetical protein